MGPSYKARCTERESTRITREIAAAMAALDAVEPAKAAGITPTPVEPAKAPAEARQAPATAPTVQPVAGAQNAPEAGDSGLSGTLSKAWDAARNGAGDTVEAIGNAASKALDEVKDVALGAAKGVGEAVNTALNVAATDAKAEEPKPDGENQSAHPQDKDAGADGSDQKNSWEKLWDAIGPSAAHAADKPKTIELPKGFATWMDLFRFAAKQAGDEKLATYAAKLACVESGLGTMPYNGKSVSGLAHFIDGTWNDMAKRFGVDSKKNFGLTTDGKLDAFQGAVAAVLYAKHNANEMKKDPELNAIVSKRPDSSFTDYELNMAHFLGTYGGKEFLKALLDNNKRNDPVTKYVGKRSTDQEGNMNIFYNKGTDGLPDTNKPRTVQEVFKLKSDDFDAKVRRFQARLNAQNSQQ